MEEATFDSCGSPTQPSRTLRPLLDIIEPRDMCPGFGMLFPSLFPSLSSEENRHVNRAISAATQTLEMETYVLPTRLRLKQRGQDVVLGLTTVSKDHPIQTALERAKKRAAAKGNNTRLAFAQVLKAMSEIPAHPVGLVDPRLLKPWRTPIGHLVVARDKEIAKRTVEAFEGTLW